MSFKYIFHIIHFKCFRIDINFQTSEKTSPRDDIGLHVSLRIAEGYVARNSCQGNIWGEEQGDGVLPIQPGQRFELIVFADNSVYKVHDTQ